MDLPTLTANASSALWSGNTDFQPIMQCTDARSIQAASGNPGATERFRVALSDGEYYVHAMLATQLVDCVKSGEMGPGTIVRLIDFLCNVVHGRKITIVLNMEILGRAPIRGNPQNVASKGQNAMPPAAPAVQAQPQQQQYQLGYSSYQNMPPQTKQNTMNPVQQGMHPAPGMMAYNKENLQQGNAVPLAKAEAPAGNRAGAPGGGNLYNNGGDRSMQQYSGMNNNYQQAPHSAFPQVTPNYMPKGAISRNEAPVRIVGIKSLNPYLNRWTIQARVTHKGEIRRWSNARGDGTVFNFDVVDADGGEIRLNAFKETCEKFYPLIEVGKVYMISKGALRPARKQYNPLNSDFEITLESSSVVEPCVDDESTSKIPSINFNFKAILELEQLPSGSLVDVIGVVLTVDSCVTIQRKDGTDTQKRTLTIKDDSNAVIEFTLWGSYCMNPGQQLEVDNQKGLHPIVAVKSARVGEFNGKTLGTISSTQVLVNADIPEAGRLRHWYDQAGGAHQQAVQLNLNGGGGGSKERRIALSQIKDDALGTAGKPDYVECLATIAFVKNENVYYPACSLQRNNRLCNKKVTLTDDGVAWCETCQQKCQPEMRYILQISVRDYSFQQWITAFGDVGDSLMGITANELKRLEGTPQYDYHFTRALFQQKIFKFKISEDTYNDEKKIRVSVVNCKPVDYAQESSSLLSKIEELLQDNQPNNNVQPNTNMNAHTYSNIGYDNQYKKQRTFDNGGGGGVWNIYQ